MSSTFKIVNSSFINSRNMFVLIGIVESGSVESGMRIKDYFNNVDMVINSVEMVNAKSSNELIGLSFVNKSEYEFSLLRRLLPGSMLLVE
jgi:translation elongation factor EF-1alpha